MIAKKALKWTLILLCFCTAFVTGLPVIQLFRVREFAKTFTKYGPLPPITIPAHRYVVLAAAAALLLAGILALCRVRMAAPIALGATLTQWIFYGPALRAYITGDGLFDPTPPVVMYVAPQRFAWLIATMSCALWMTIVEIRSAKWR